MMDETDAVVVETDIAAPPEAVWRAFSEPALATVPVPTDNPRSTARIGGHPIHPMLVPAPISCFVGTLVTDIAYAKTANMLWADMSAWLLTASPS